MSYGEINLSVRIKLEIGYIDDDHCTVYDYNYDVDKAHLVSDLFRIFESKELKEPATHGVEYDRARLSAYIDSSLLKELNYVPICYFVRLNTCNGPIWAAEEDEE